MKILEVLFFTIVAVLHLTGCITGSSTGARGVSNATSGGGGGVTSGLLSGLEATGGSGTGGKGGDLGNLSNLIRNVGGQQNHIENATIESQSVSNSLNSLEQTLPFIRSYESGEHIYMNLNNAWSQLTGTSTIAHLTTQYPSVNVVHEQIANLRAFLESQENLFKNMSNQQLAQYVQKLQMVNQTITSASIAVNSTAQANNPIGTGGVRSPRATNPGTRQITNY